VSGARRAGIGIREIGDHDPTLAGQGCRWISIASPHAGGDEVPVATGPRDPAAVGTGDCGARLRPLYTRAVDQASVSALVEAASPRMPECGSARSVRASPCSRSGPTPCVACCRLGSLRRPAHPSPARHSPSAACRSAVSPRVASCGATACAITSPSRRAPAPRRRTRSPSAPIRPASMTSRWAASSRSVSSTAP
jgi:hypothetical protein